MKKQILNIGKALDKSEQMQVKGGVDCVQCHNYCLANNPFDRLAFGNCMALCIDQYC